MIKECLEMAQPTDRRRPRDQTQLHLPTDRPLILRVGATAAENINRKVAKQAVG